jgi:hypothetical protein
MARKLYLGDRTAAGCVVTVNGKPLAPRLDLGNHSPTGFEWGYGGSGPAQLALALLADATGDADVALALYQRFKREVVGRLDHDGWSMTAEEIRGWVRAVRPQALGADPDIPFPPSADS